MSASETRPGGINGRLGEGLRMPANAGRTAGCRAGVRKPPKGEPAGLRAPAYGNLAERLRCGRSRDGRAVAPRAGQPGREERARVPFGPCRAGMPASAVVVGSARQVAADAGTRVSDGRSRVASTVL